MQNFTLSITGTYTRDEIPPRCRKPRPVTYPASAQVEIPAYTRNQAPVAFRIKALRGHEDFEATNDIRTINGRLYAPYLPYSRQTEPTIPGDSNFPQDVDADRIIYSLRADSDETFSQEVEEHYSAYVIIDGTVWVETSEPKYNVDTFGFGNNHGGTGLMVNGHHGTFFRADEFADALAYAIRVAKGRGDTDNVTRFTENPGQYRAIEVLIPEAVTLVTFAPAPKEVRTLRFEYDNARSRLRNADNPNDETEGFAEVVKLREKIVALGYTPVEPSDQTPYEARNLATGEIA